MARRVVATKMSKGCNPEKQGIVKEEGAQGTQNLWSPKKNKAKRTILGDSNQVEDGKKTQTELFIE